MWRCGSWKSPALVHVPLNQAAPLFVVTYAWFWDKLLCPACYRSSTGTVETLQPVQVDTELLSAFNWFWFYAFWMANLLFEVSLKSFLRMEDLLHASLLGSVLLQIEKKKKERKRRRENCLHPLLIYWEARCLHASLQKGMAIFKIWVDATRRLFREMRISLYF